MSPRKNLIALLVLPLAACAVGRAWATTDTLPRRVVTFAPNITESVFALGAGDRVVGVSDFSQYPPEAATRKRCGGDINPSFEALLALKPDLILVEGRAEKIHDFCRDNKIPIVSLTMNSIATIRSDLRLLGRTLGVTRTATSLTLQIDAELTSLRVDLPEAERPRVFLSISRPEGAIGTLLTAGGGTFLDEITTLAGGKNIFADRREPYPLVSKETLVHRRPDIILELRPSETVDAARKKRLDADWAPLSSIPAVRNKRIIYLTQDYLLYAGPRVGQTARALRTALHPEFE